MPNDFGSEPARAARCPVLVALAVCLSATAANARPGALDPSFGSGGSAGPSPTTPAEGTLQALTARR